MLKKIYRLSSVGLTRPISLKGKLVNIKTSPNNQEISRFAFVISKKVDKKAVVRNSVKRKLSASIEELFDRIENGFDFVVYAKKEISGASQLEISKEMQGLLNKKQFIK